MGGNRYPNVADHGLIGDLQTAAPVTGTGTVDWFFGVAINLEHQLDHGAGVVNVLAGR